MSRLPDCEDKLLVIESTAMTSVTRAHCKEFVVKHHSVKSTAVS